MKENHLPLGQANLDIFSKTMLDLAEKNTEIMVVTSDSRGSARLTRFGEKFPQQMIEIGIAEQNLVGVSAGLAMSGKTVFAVSPACFLTSRALEQIKNDIAYSNNPVRIIGISAGVSYGSLGSTHHSLHDFAVLQAINNIDIVAPADNFETVQTIRAVEHHSRPIYIRFGKKPLPRLHSSSTKFEIGKAIRLTPDSDSYEVAFFAIGEAVGPAYIASLVLAEQGVTSCVLSIHSLRPFDEMMVAEIAEKSEVIITVEEHSVNGGLGARVAALLMQSGIFRPLRIVGIPDEPTVTGSQMEIFNHYGISPHGLSAAAIQMLEKL
jgi:transketolase